MDAEILRGRMPITIRKKLMKKIYDPGNPIIIAGYENKYVFFLIEGEAEASIQNNDGTVATVYLYKSNSIFGEVEPFYNDFKPVSITATKKCIVEALHQTDFLEWLKSDFEATKLLIRIISEKLIHNGQLIEEMSLLSVRKRALRCIAIYNHKGQLYKLTKKQLSIEANTPIRSVNRAIAECVKMGLISYENKQIHIKNLAVVMEHLPSILHF